MSHTLKNRYPSNSQGGLEQLLTPTQVASKLCVKVQTLAAWRTSKKYSLSYVKVGAKILYRQSDVQKFIDARLVNIEA